MNENTKTALLAAILLLPAHADATLRDSLVSTGKSAYNSTTSVGNRAYRTLTFADCEHPKATKYRNELDKVLNPKVKDLTEASSSAKAPVSMKEQNQCLDSFTTFNESYKAVNYQRAWIATSMTALSAGLFAATWFLPTSCNNQTVQKARYATAATGITSFLAMLGFGYKARTDVDSAIKKASNIEIQKQQPEKEQK
ncbi:MAG: hypothetical protein JO129_02960 [Candidatus Dependentiae bacterium]|nr:hypothetical protein [Candidatus Dependentiae bacterium]